MFYLKSEMWHFSTRSLCKIEEAKKIYHCFYTKKLDKLLFHYYPVTNADLFLQRITLYFSIIQLYISTALPSLLASNLQKKNNNNNKFTKVHFRQSLRHKNSFEKISSVYDLFSKTRNISHFTLNMSLDVTRSNISSHCF